MKKPPKEETKAGYWDDIRDSLEILKKAKDRTDYTNNPKQLLAKALEYFQWCDNNPIGDKVRPYTVAGLCIKGLGRAGNYLADLKGDIKNGQIEEKDELSEVVELIYSICDNQKLEGSMVNIFNSNIVARLLGLVDKQQVEEKGNITLNVSEAEADV